MEERRAKVDVTHYYLEAVSGKVPGVVPSNCGKCKQKTGVEGHSHSAFCKTNKKLKDVDKKPMQKVFAVLRSIAHETSASAMVRRRTPFAN